MTTVESRGNRLDTIDAVRGLVMVIMALDHVRDILQTAPFEAVDLEKTTPVLFMTRWVSHLCAPTFVFLAGVGAALSLQKKSRAELSWFLITRGLWLIFLEVFIVFFAWFPYSDFSFIPCSVLWALGWSMIALAGLIWLPQPAIMILALAIICCHNLLDIIQPRDLGQWDWFWKWFHDQGPIRVTSHTILFMAYPILPWIGVMAFGFACGPMFLQSDRRKWFVWLGLYMLALFLVLRWNNGYGDQYPWKYPSRPGFQILSFIDCTKYPPSLDYCLMTLGIMFLLLALCDRARNPISEFLMVYGRVPLFYYLIHLPLIELFALGMLLVGWQQGWYAGDSIIDREMNRYLGLSLWGSYVIWIVVIALLYYPCKTFGAWKRRSKNTWLSYF